jgi:ParB family chromosome partitioning protein
MAETLEPGSAMIETLGRELNVNMAAVWQTDNTLLDLIRDREVMTHILADVAGADVAEANAKATVKVQRGIVHDCLTGSNGRAKVEVWVPRWMQFPPSAYTVRGGVGSVDRSLDLSAREEQPQDATQLAAEAEPERQAA